MIADGKVALVVSQYGGMKVDVFPSVKQLIQHFITQQSLEGGWGSQEQLDALRETKELLDRTVVRVAEEVAAELSDDS